MQLMDIQACETKRGFTTCPREVMTTEQKQQVQGRALVWFLDHRGRGAIGLRAGKSKDKVKPD